MLGCNFNITNEFTDLVWFKVPLELVWDVDPVLSCYRNNSMFSQPVQYSDKL